MKTGEVNGEGVFKNVPTMGDEELTAFNVYITLVNKKIISVKTLLEKFGFDFEAEQKQLKIEDKTIPMDAYL